PPLPRARPLPHDVPPRPACARRARRVARARGPLARRRGALRPRRRRGRRRLLPSPRRLPPRRLQAPRRRHLHPRARRPPPRALRVGRRGLGGRAGRAGREGVRVPPEARRPRMTAFTFDDTHAGHAQAGHAERRARIQPARALLEREGLWRAARRLPTPEASREALERVHPPAYLDLLEDVAEAGGAQLDPDTYATADRLGIA